MERSKPMGHSPTAFSLRTSICAYESAVLMDTTKNSYKKDIGYFIGMLHGGMLSPSTQQLRPEVTPLVTNKDNARGYRVGREFFFKNFNRSGGRGKRRGYVGDAEYFGVYCAELNTVYLVPINIVPYAGEVHLRIQPTKNNQEKKVIWAKDYEIQ